MDKDAQSFQCYFKPTHRNSLYIISAWFERRGNKNQVHVSYQIKDGKFRTPRQQCKHLDNKEDALITRELRRWKDRVNGTPGLSAERSPLPSYLKHRSYYIKWLARTATSSTINNYIHDLETHCFGYFYGIRSIDKVEKFPKFYSEWITWLQKTGKASKTIKHCVQALRKYIAFLSYQKGYSAIPLPVSPPLKKEEASLPGNLLPGWEEIVIWLKSLPPGPERWAITLMAAFGIRVSESLAMTRSNLFGKKDVDQLTTNQLIQHVVSKHNPLLFLAVDVAVKQNIADKNVILYTQFTNKPKTGSYISACYNREIAVFIQKLVKNHEYEGTTTKDKTRKAIRQSRHPILSQYSNHDLRGLNITLQAIDIRDFEIVSRLHGHKSVQVTQGYYKLGLELTRKVRVSDDLELIG